MHYDPFQPAKQLQRDGDGESNREGKGEMNGAVAGGVRNGDKCSQANTEFERSERDESNRKGTP